MNKLKSRYSPHNVVKNVLSKMAYDISMSYPPGWHLISGKYWRMRMYRREDLGRFRPDNHPDYIAHRGKTTLIRPGQVWLERGIHELWVVIRCFDNDRGRPCVEIRPYYPANYVPPRASKGIDLMGFKCVISLQHFKSTKILWDDHTKFVKTLPKI